jgi:uncharacterized protein
MSSRSPAQATLLVDGYNIIGAWSDLQQKRDQDSLEEARRALVEKMANYSAFQGYQTQIIFDAQYQNTMGYRDVVAPTLLLHYTDFGQTADTYIEKYCATFQRNGNRTQGRLIVATSDRVQQLMILGYGAEWMSALQLRLDVDATVTRIRSRSRQRDKKTKSRQLLGHSLDPVAQERLTKLRLGIRLD